MGLIQAALSAATSTLSDQWKEYFYCEAIPNNIIAVKGHKRTSGFSSNRGNDNIITDGSVIAVADGQCMIIVEQGKVVDICSEPGEYKYDSATEPSIFTSTLSDGVKNTFAQIGKRFMYGGQPAEDQRIYYFNMKELVGQKYGTASPIPFRVLDERAGIDIDISLKCFGEYSLKVTDPILFYTNVCGNFKDTYAVSNIESMLKSELLTALQPAFAKIGASGVRYSALLAHTTDLCNILNDELSEKWAKTRGIEIESFGINSIKADEADEALLKKMQAQAAYTNQALGTAAYVNAVTQSMVDAANNPNGAAMGFVGLNAAQSAGAAANIGALYQNQNPAPAQPVPAQAAMNPAAGSWTCPNCGQVGTGNFCTNCGTKRPVLEWTCPTCGQVQTGNFCTNCGTKRPQ